MTAADGDSTPARGPELVKMSELSRLSGVPAPTIKHYLREGLLPPPARRTGRNMAYYDRRLVERIRAIKQLQREQFLPLEVIRELLDTQLEPGAEGEQGLSRSARAIARVLTQLAQRAEETPSAAASELAEPKTRADLLAAGVEPDDLALLERLGLLQPQGRGAAARYAGDDLRLLRTLGRARRSGLAAEMLPIEILGEYVAAVRALVRVELRLFREGVLPRASGEQLDALTEAATELSEQLLVLVRRRLLVPTLRELASEPAAPEAASGRPPAAANAALTSRRAKRAGTPER